jgi:hypothetical protein
MKRSYSLVIALAVLLLVGMKWVNADTGGNLALNKSVTVSSTENGGTMGSYAVDGNTGTRWSSAFSDPQWIYVDLGSAQTVAKVILNWEVAYGKSYQIQLSNDAVNWSTVYATTSGDGGSDEITFNAATARFVRMNGSARGTGYGYSLWEFEVYGPGSVTPTPTPVPTNGPVDFGPNVFIFDPSMSGSAIQSRVDGIFAEMESNQFGNQRYAFFFKPGSYNVNVNLGYYTSVYGLGARPDDVTITGSVRCEADWMNGNATCNFWRSAENYAVIPTYSANPLAPSGTETWGASQAAPLRRAHIKGNLTLWDWNPANPDGSWSSGGFIADSLVDGEITSGSQQQYLTRNVQMGSWNGSNWNMVFVGDRGAPGEQWPNPAYTVINQTPVVREKPFLYIDGSGTYNVFVPALRTNATGLTWTSGMGPGTSLPIGNFYIAKPGVTVSTLNQELENGKNLIFTPGIYQLSAPIKVTRADTVILGLGMATIMPVNGTAAMTVADVAGVKIAGLLFDAGPTNSPLLLEVGPAGSSASHSSNPVSLHDLFFRVGGAGVGKADVCLKINSNDVIGDHFWVWRADHGEGAGWTTNTTQNGIIVNGNNVTIYGLFVEHYHQYQTIWNGNNGNCYFYQSEIPYDVPAQSAWMNGNTYGWASYKVANTVATHHLYGSGVYSYFRDADCRLESGIEVPNTAGVRVYHACSVYLTGYGEITHVVNNMGAAAKSGAMRQTIVQYP